jgi:hypothetical protein
MSRARWIDRQVDDALIAISTATGIMYARRRARRVIPKVMVGGTVAAAAVVATGIGIVAVGGAGLAWYRHRPSAAASAGDWQMPSVAVNGTPAQQSSPAPASE